MVTDRRLILGAIALGWLACGAWAAVLVQPANGVAASGGTWANLDYSFVDDTLYASGLGLANGTSYFRVDLADPAGTDTLDRAISRVVIYAKGYSSYSKSKVRLRPYFAGTAGTESPNQAFGLTEAIRSFDVTPQIVSWRWQDVADLSVRFTPRTAATFYVNYIFAQVTCYDTTIVLQAHHFSFAPIPSPETLAVQFPLTIYARDSLDSLVSTYDDTAALWDSTGTVLPMTGVFAAGVCNVQAAIFDVGNTAITADDGSISGTSNGFQVVNPGLYRFAFGPVPSPQTVAVPFGISLAAYDYFGDTATAFTGQADLWDVTGTLAPDSTGPFVDGVWSGTATVNSTSSWDTLFCSHTTAKGYFTGFSNGFAVQPSGVETNPDRPIPIRTFSAVIRPNPVKTRADIELQLPAEGGIQASLFNILGQEVLSRDFGKVPAGIRHLGWQFEKTLNPGIYFMTITYNDEMRIVRKVLAVK